MGQSLNLFGACRQVQLMILDNANSSQVASTCGSGNAVNANCGGAACSDTGTSYISNAKNGWDFVSQYLRSYLCFTFATSSFDCIDAADEHRWNLLCQLGRHHVLPEFAHNNDSAQRRVYSCHASFSRRGTPPNLRSPSLSAVLYTLAPSLFAAVVLHYYPHFAAVDSNCFAHITGCHSSIGLDEFFTFLHLPRDLFVVAPSDTLTYRITISLQVRVAPPYWG